MFATINSLADFQGSLEQNDAVLFYFSHENCNVCKVLKPKIEELILRGFPKMKLFYCDTFKSPELAAQNQIFTVPTLLVFFRGKEYIRKSRNLGIEELKSEIWRSYDLLFN